MILALLLSCQDYSINEQKIGEPIVAPDFIDFGHLRSGHEIDLRQIIFTNAGNAPLRVERLEVVGENFYIDESGFVVEPSHWLALDVVYDPKTYEFNEGYIDVYLEGDNEPMTSVWLQGNGDAPVIEISPVEVNYGTVSQDCESDAELEITNIGNLDLHIEGISQFASIPQEITTDYGTLSDFPWILAPGARISFWTNFVASTVSTHSLTLNVASNDPQEPAYTVSAVGDVMISTTMHESLIQGNSMYVDIIWIIDNSGSMRWAQNKLAQNVINFINLFMQYGPNFKMAVITTDSPNFLNGITLTQNDPNLVLNVANLISSVGNQGSATEAGLHMLETSYANNISWFRQGAHLVTIFLSDEMDHSPMPYSYYTTSFDNRIPYGMFLPYAIIGDVPNGCNFAQAGGGYYEFVNHYNTQWWSICAEDWGSQMEDIALAIINASAFVLDYPSPKEDTISVWLNGQMMTEGWEYIPESNSIAFEPAHAPEEGDSIDVWYEIWECE